MNWTHRNTFRLKCERFTNEYNFISVSTSQAHLLILKTKIFLCFWYLLWKFLFSFETQKDIKRHLNYQHKGNRYVGITYFFVSTHTNFVKHREMWINFALLIVTIQQDCNSRNSIIYFEILTFLYAITFVIQIKGNGAELLANI